MNASKLIGRTYDIQSLFDRLNKIYFDGKLELTVEWSGRSSPKAKRRVLLGYYLDKEKKIVLSRRLDNPRVPLYFVEMILFHEMLHAVFPRERHRMHTEKFKKFEKLHPDFERAQVWEKENIKILFEKAQILLPFEYQEKSKMDA